MMYRIMFTALCIAVVALSTTGCGSREAAAPPAAKPSPQAPPQPVASPVPAPTAPAETTAKSWNFLSLPQQKWEWQFADGATVLQGKGACYETATAGMGPVWTGKPFDAMKYKGLRVVMVVTRPKENEEGRRPVDVAAAPMLYWAAPKEAKDPAWAPHPKKKVKAGRPLPENPYLWEFKLEGHSLWKGPIGALAFSAPIREEGDKPARVCVKEITFLE